MRPPPLAPRTVFLSVLAIVLAAGAACMMVDVWRVGELPIHLWLHLYNDRPIEWMQWLMLPSAMVLAAYLAGQLRETPLSWASGIWLLFAVGIVGILLEDAGDIRHVLSDYAFRMNDYNPRIMGIHYRIIVEMPYFALIAALPVYVLLRYGRDIWRSPRARIYMVGGYLLYGGATVANGLRHLGGGRDAGGLYSKIGAWFDQTIAGGAILVPEGMTQARMHFMLIDGPVEESIELLGATCLFCMVLAFAHDAAEGKIIERDG